jgi:F0F1-type ATP synthase alpha subunit
MDTNERIHFQKFIDSGQPVGEVIGVSNFLVRVKGLQPINVHALVIFEDGSKGFVQHILEDFVIILHLGTALLKVGMVAVQRTSGKSGKRFCWQSGVRNRQAAGR